MGTLSLAAVMIGTSVSHYRILASIGAGGMGVVYRAEDLRPFDWLMKSGRAFIYPIYKSTFERGDEVTR